MTQCVITQPRRDAERALKVFGPRLTQFKSKADKAKCAGDTQYLRAHFNAVQRWFWQVRRCGKYLLYPL